MGKPKIKSNKVVVLSGAGISAPSGLATFRDADGLWEKYRIEDVATPDAWARNPGLVLEFYNMRRAAAAEALPNAAHKAIADLESGFEVVVVTQNVDDLHERAGSTHVLHLHGEQQSPQCIQSSIGDSYRQCSHSPGRPCGGWRSIASAHCLVWRRGDAV